MPSPVDIANLALSHIGDVADVQSIFPPDGSVQAGFCNRFYPIALKVMLEQGTWNFATRRVGLAPVLKDRDIRTWRFAYAAPAGMLTAISVLEPFARNDYTEWVGRMDGMWGAGWVPPTVWPPDGPPVANPLNPPGIPEGDWDAYWYNPEPDYPGPGDNIYTPKPFTIETAQDGSKIILTNVPFAILRYTLEVIDPNQWSGLFTLAFSYMLASMLAGPLIKGNTGAQVGGEMLQAANSYIAQASTQDANQRHLELRQRTPWIAERETGWGNR